VFFLLIVGVVVVVVVLYAADRFIKARAQTRRLAAMSERLDAATERTDKKLRKRQEVAKASAELTSLIPAINHPPLSLRDEPLQGKPAPDDPALDEPAFDEPDGVAAMRKTGPDATAVLDAPLFDVPLVQAPIGEPAPAEATGPGQVTT
jgi:hypothetical protein